MKSINVYFDNTEYKKLKKEKKKLTWHDFILKLLDNENNEKIKSN